MNQSGWRRWVKRAVDRGVAAVGLVVAAPVLVGVAAAVRVTMGGPVLFRQERSGQHGRPFRIVKFRTMVDRYDAAGRPLPDAERTTAFGRFLRASSLDELPQLWNVLTGDVSVVGPRPLMSRYLPRYNAAQRRRLDVIPGITGWAQINGRNTLSWEQKFELDAWYVEHWSLALDARIFLATLWHLARPRGISREGHATMPEFMGTPADNAGEDAGEGEGTDDGGAA